MDNPAHPWAARRRKQGRHLKHHFDEVNIEGLAAQLKEAGFAKAEGALTTFAGRPAKVIRALR